MGILGQRFGRFQIIREIGRGTVARVYLASDGASVQAVKLFPVEERERAERELRYGHGLDHPHLNPVDGRVDIAGRPGVVMPFVPGLRLARLLAEGTDHEAFLDAVGDLFSALAYLHGRGVLHRDVKPENILVNRAGEARLLDFDLAIGRHEAQRGGLAGTVAYLSPEQARGEPASEASDLYAAGIILYRGLAGEVPFSGSVGEVVRAHRDEVPRALSGFDRRLAPFEPLVERLLAKDAADRPHDAAAVAAELERLRREP